RQNEKSNYWKCKQKRCKATLTIDFEDQKVGVSAQKHSIVEPSSETCEVPLTDNQIKALKFVQKVKSRVSNGDEAGTSKILEDEQNKLFKTLNTLQEKDDIATLIPSFQKMKYGLQKRKGKNRSK
ncbi:unnamed protein product, partial [Brachionus calyciflorus]